MKILGVDPGKTTGLCIIEDASLPITIEFFNQVEFEDDISQAIQRLVYQVDHVAIERFTISTRTLKMTRQMEAVYVIGGTIFLCELEGVDWSLQTPADAKAAFSDELLADMDVFDAVKGPHARDALRHALLGRRRRRLKKPKKKNT